ACRRGWRQHGDRYQRQIVFIAGLPKSGTTWLERMVASYPGFHELLIPDVAAYELATGGSHDYELPDDLFSRFERMLVITKMHVHGSPHNAGLLHQARVRYAVLFRDLRDVAVSHYFYVRNTHWHPEYPVYARLSIEEGLAEFATRTLPGLVDWVRSWHEHLDEELGMIIRYEDLLEDTVGVMTTLAGHFELDGSPETVGRIVERHRFERLAAGRRQGEERTSSFFRKGVAGDWRNHFTPKLIELYACRLGDFLVEYGYEKDPIDVR
ncbi:MAG: sulfotransferase domain-containing protein, partial [Planctomycetota bacterium]